MFKVYTLAAAQGRREGKMQSIAEAVFKNAEKYPEKTAIIFKGKTLTYQELKQRIVSFALELKRKKTAKGSRILLEADDLRSYFCGFLGCHLYGCIAVPVEKNISIYKLQDILRLTKPKLIFMGNSGEKYADYLNHGETGSARLTKPKGNTICTVTSTTGTTGKPSLVAHDNRALAATCENLAKGTGISSDTVLFSNIPADLAAGYRRVFAALLAGGTAVIADEPLSGKILSRYLKDYEIRHLTVICSDLPLLVSDEVPDTLLSSVSAVESVAGILPPDTTSRFYRKFPDAVLYNVYGSTESGCILINDTKENYSEKCIGRPMKNARVMLVDENGDEVLTPGKYGYITVNGEMNMREYYKNKSLTEKVMTAKGLVLNDIAYFDKDGFYYFVSRVGDIINVQGHKVAPVTIESAAALFPGVRDCACTARNDLLYGQVPVLYIETEKNMEVDPEELKTYLTKNLESYCIPSEILFIDKIPRTVSGKLMRKSLALLYHK